MSVTPKGKLEYLLRGFLQGELDAQSFSEQFSDVYNLEVDYATLNVLERKEFRALMVVASRFSPFEEDLINYDCYFGEHQLREKAKEVCHNLGLQG